MNRLCNKLLWVVLICLGSSHYACEETITIPDTSLAGEGFILPDGTEFTRTALLESFGTCIVNELKAFEEQSHLFAVVATESLDDPNNDSAVQEAWQDTIDVWQQLEVMQVGPGDKSTRSGGLGLRDAIYAWPLNNECAVDSYLISEAYLAEESMIRFNASGLTAAEYLLFHTETNNACEADYEINTDGSWEMLDEGLLYLRRSTYAAMTANMVAETATSLVNEWIPSGENFLAEFTQAGEGSRFYGKKRVAINAVSDALSYVEWAVKDSKLAKPLGLRDCDQPFCSDLVESKYGRRSKEHLKNNMIGFRKLFKGCGADNSGLGFDDYLYALDQADLAEQIDEAAIATISAIDAVEEKDLVTALETDLESVINIHRTLDQLTDILRSDFIIALNLELPVMVQGDND